MGTISGDITEINWNDPQRTVVMELEANNLEDENGDVKKGKYFSDGYVSEEPSGPGFWYVLALWTPGHHRNTREVEWREVNADSPVSYCHGWGGRNQREGPRERHGRAHNATPAEFGGA
jgi:hypothetical protein